MVSLQTAQVVSLASLPVKNVEGREDTGDYCAVCTTVKSSGRSRNPIPLLLHPPPLEAKKLTKIEVSKERYGSLTIA